MCSLTKEEFLEEYKLQDVYQEEYIEWGTIQDIFSDYIDQHSEMTSIKNELLQLLENELEEKVHSIESRIKQPKHLIEKIIRKICIEDNDKYSEISKKNYREIVRDLIGIRILVLSKEEWEIVHNALCNIFCNPNEECRMFMAEEPKAYIRYGDRDVFHNRIYTAYTNKGYRSQHYIVQYRGWFCEIQVRTIAEEVFGEFDHKVRYPYRADNKFLKRYTNTMSQSISMIDEMISTCLQMKDKMWDECSNLFENDHYVNWVERSKNVNLSTETENISGELPVDAVTLANNKILRRREN